MNRLCNFGEMVQQILTRLYEANKNAAQQELLQSVEIVFGSAELLDSDAWWATCEGLLASIAQLVGLAEIRVYVRSRNHYSWRLPRGGPASQIPTREVLSSLRTGQFQKASEDSQARQLAKDLAVPTDGAWFYVSSARAEGSPLSTFLVLRGKLQPQHKELTGALCRIIAQNVDFFTLVGRQRQSQREYRETVAEVAHDFRTPLQILVFDLQWVSRLDAVKNDPLIAERIDQSIARAIAANEHVLRLLGAPTEQRERIDLVGLVSEVMKDLKPMADRHPCELRKAGTWLNAVVVRGSAYHLRRAFTNLVENAIKYSWCGKKIDRGQELYRVDVSLDLWARDMVRVRISDYGIGIPPEMIEQIKESGGRGLVPDDRVERGGTGRGLSTAVSILEDHGGFLDIRSEPADSKPRLGSESYHRYVTTVDAYLPVVQ